MSMTDHQANQVITQTPRWLIVAALGVLAYFAQGIHEQGQITSDAVLVHDLRITTNAAKTTTNLDRINVLEKSVAAIQRELDILKLAAHQESPDP